jgi:hypothetical protein
MSKQVEFLVKLRDGAQMIADAANEYLETLAPPGVKEEKTLMELGPAENRMGKG